LAITNADEWPADWQSRLLQLIRGSGELDELGRQALARDIQAAFDFVASEASPLPVLRLLAEHAESVDVSQGIETILLNQCAISGNWDGNDYHASSMVFDELSPEQAQWIADFVAFCELAASRFVPPAAETAEGAETPTSLSFGAQLAYSLILGQAHPKILQLCVEKSLLKPADIRHPVVWARLIKARFGNPEAYLAVCAAADLLTPEIWAATLLEAVSIANAALTKALLAYHQDRPLPEFPAMPTPNLQLYCGTARMHYHTAFLELVDTCRRSR
jgi:hypothetical protein